MPATALRDIEFTVVHELIPLEIAPVLADLQRSDGDLPLAERLLAGYGSE